jgi:hypothetical protein
LSNTITLETKSSPNLRADVSLKIRDQTCCVRVATVGAIAQMHEKPLQQKQIRRENNRSGTRIVSQSDGLEHLCMASDRAGWGSTRRARRIQDPLPEPHAFCTIMLVDDRDAGDKPGPPRGASN